jgi:hypothetical protein
MFQPTMLRSYKKDTANPFNKLRTRLRAPIDLLARLGWIRFCALAPKNLDPTHGVCTYQSDGVGFVTQRCRLGPHLSPRCRSIWTSSRRESLSNFLNKPNNISSVYYDFPKRGFTLRLLAPNSRFALAELRPFELSLCMGVWTLVCQFS